MKADRLIPATVIGSWSFPGWYEKFVKDVGDDPDAFGAADREEAVQDAVRLAVDDQLSAGLDRITDPRRHPIDDFSCYTFYIHFDFEKPIDVEAAYSNWGHRTAPPDSGNMAPSSA